MSDPDWRSLSEIARIWSDETGESADALESDLEAWFSEFVARERPLLTESNGSGHDTTNLLIGLLGGRYLQRSTLASYCDERCRAKPLFWFGDDKIREPESSGHRSTQSREKPRGQIITVGGYKGGTGKSTTAMHLAVSLLYDGYQVCCIDVDRPQATLSRYMDNRRALNLKKMPNVPVPEHVGFPMSRNGIDVLGEYLHQMTNTYDFIVIDTPSGSSTISQIFYSWTDILITPINDSFVDLDLLAVLDNEGKQMQRRGHFSEMVAQARKQKFARTCEGFDWIVLRNRLSNLESRNKNRMADALNSLAEHLDFRNCSGLSERVIYREMFLNGLTLLDLPERGAGVTLSMSHVAARQELRALVQSIAISTTVSANRVIPADGPTSHNSYETVKRDF